MITIEKIEKKDLNDQDCDIKFKENPSNDFKTEVDVKNINESDNKKEDDILVEEMNEKKD